MEIDARELNNLWDIQLKLGLGEDNFVIESWSWEGKDHIHNSNSQ